jgi:subtilisin family serine protease
VAEQDSKLTRDLLYSLQEARRGEAVSVIVRYVPDRRIMRQRVHVPGAEETYNYRLRPFVHMRATPDAIQGLVADPAVVRIYEDKPVYALLDASVPHLEIPRLWDAGYTGKGVRLAIVDTGIDLNRRRLRPFHQRRLSRRGSRGLTLYGQGAAQRWPGHDERRHGWHRVGHRTGRPDHQPLVRRPRPV